MERRPGPEGSSHRAGMPTPDPWQHRNGRLTTEPVADYRTDLLLQLSPIGVAVSMLLFGLLAGTSLALYVFGAMMFATSCFVSLDATENLNNIDGTIRWDGPAPAGLTELNARLEAGDPVALQFNRSMLDGQLTDGMERALISGTLRDSVPA